MSAPCGKCGTPLHVNPAEGVVWCACGVRGPADPKPRRDLPPAFTEWAEQAREPGAGFLAGPMAADAARIAKTDAAIAEHNRQVRYEEARLSAWTVTAEERAARMRQDGPSSGTGET